MLAFCGHMMAQDKIWRIASPQGFIRKETSGFGDYLRNLPLKPIGTKVKLYDGSLKGWQGGAYAVVDMEIGTSDLQQCADAVMRLRAEYLWHKKKNMKRYTLISLMECVSIIANGHRAIESR